MKFNYAFKHVPRSQKLMGYAEGKLDKIKKFELNKAFKVEFIFSGEKRTKQAEILIYGKDIRYAAKGFGENLYQAVDQAIARVSKQLKRNKDKVQNHKHYEFSNEGHMDCLTPEMDMDYSKLKGVNKPTEAA